MNDSNLLKLVFFHDQRMEELSSSNVALPPSDSDPLALFTKPDPTYSKLLFMGTELTEMRFGLNCLDRYTHLLDLFSTLYIPVDSSVSERNVTLDEWFDSAPVNAFIILQSTLDEDTEKDSQPSVSSESKGLFSEAVDLQKGSWGYEIGSDHIRSILTQGYQVLIKKPARHGYDLELYSKTNPYISFFYPIQSMLPNAFRFFSINGKRVHTREALFFEQSRLHNPPHGFEEVHPESVL